MAIENYQRIRARELGLPLGTGKDYSRDDLKSFMDAAEEIEGGKYTDRFFRNVLIGFATPPAVALTLSCLPHTEIHVLQAVQGAALMLTAAETGWIGGGLIIEGGRALKRAVTFGVSSNISK